MPFADSTVSDLKALVDAAEAIRKPFEAQVYLNLAFYTGDQWVAWDGHTVYEPELEDWRAKVVDNRIQPAIRTEIAKMTKQRPTWVATPATQSDDDVSAARYLEALLYDAWRRHCLTHKLRAALMWARVATMGYWKVVYDPTVGKRVSVLTHADTGKVMRNRMGAPLKPEQINDLPAEVAAIAQPKDIAMGDACIQVRNFFQIAVDPHATDEGLESAEYIAERSVYTRDYCAKHFSDKLDELDFTESPTSGVGRARMAMSRFSGSIGVTQSQAKGVELCEFWSRDKHAIFTKNGVLLLEEDNPYPHLPYVLFRGTPVPGQFYADAPVTQLVPRQISLNRVLSQIEENAERVGNPPLLVPSTMDDEDFRWDGLPGQEVRYPVTGTPDAIPGFMNVPEVPGYVQNLVPTIEKSIMEISGQHEVTGASVPAGVTAASAIQLLQEADDTRLGPDIAEMDAALSRAGQMYAWIADKFFTDERHLKVSGEDGWWDVEAFKAGMLRGNTEIEAQTGSGLPMSVAAKQAAIQQTLTLMLQTGQQIPERNLRKVLSEYQIGGLEAFFASQDRDGRQVADENRRLAQGEPLQVNSYDNDDAHVEGHTDFMKTARFQRLDPKAQQIFEAHLQMHMDRQAQAQLAQQPPPPDQAPPPQGAAPPTQA